MNILINQKNTTIKWMLLFAFLGVKAIHSESLLVLPIQSDSLSSQDAKTVSILLKDNLAKTYMGALVYEENTSEICKSAACISSSIARTKVDRVLSTSLFRLGKKWILSGSIYDSEGKILRTERIHTDKIEDLDQALERLATALMNNKKMDEVVTIDNVMERESKEYTLRRQSYWTTGFALGYVYPLGSSFTYRETPLFGESKDKQYSQMIRLCWTNGWQFKNNMMLGADVAWATPVDFGADLNLLYLPKINDLTPFVGGGVGIHYVKGDDDDVDEDKRNSGLTLNVQGGLMLFRTYNINVMARTQYYVVMNSDKDQGAGFDVAIQWKKN